MDGPSATGPLQKWDANFSGGLSAVELQKAADTNGDNSVDDGEKNAFLAGIADEATRDKVRIGLNLNLGAAGPKAWDHVVTFGAESLPLAAKKEELFGKGGLAETEQRDNEASDAFLAALEELDRQNPGKYDRLIDALPDLLNDKGKMAKLAGNPILAQAVDSHRHGRFGLSAVDKKMIGSVDLNGGPTAVGDAAKARIKVNYDHTTGELKLSGPGGRPVTADEKKALAERFKLQAPAFNEGELAFGKSLMFTAIYDQLTK